MQITQDRLTVRLDLYHQSLERGTGSFPVRYAVFCEKNAQVYERFLSVSPDPVKFDTGWISDSGHVLVVNQSQEHTVTIRDSMGNPLIRIRPGCCFLGELVDPGSCHLTSTGSGSVQIVAVSR